MWCEGDSSVALAACHPQRDIWRCCGTLESEDKLEPVGDRTQRTWVLGDTAELLDQPHLKPVLSWPLSYV